MTKMASWLLVMAAVLSVSSSNSAWAFGRGKPQVPAELKDIPRGSILKLTDAIHIDVPVQQGEETHYTFRYPIYTFEGPLASRDGEVDQLHCRLEHAFRVAAPVVIPAGTSFMVKEAQEFSNSLHTGSNAEPASRYVAAIRIDYSSEYPELISVQCASEKGHLEPITVKQFEGIMGRVIELKTN